MNEISGKGRGRGAAIAIWTITIFLALEFVLAGGGKFFSGPAAGWHREFLRWGLPSWSVPVVGAVEVGAAVLLLVPRFATIGGVLLAATMVGASATHALHGEWSRGVFTLILVVLSAIVARGRGAELRLPGRRMAVATVLQFAVGRAVLDTRAVRPETTVRALWGASCPRQGNLPTQLGS